LQVADTFAWKLALTKPLAAGGGSVLVGANGVTVPLLDELQPAAIKNNADTATLQRNQLPAC
jgi:hypothetical protein